MSRSLPKAGSSVSLTNTLGQSECWFVGKVIHWVILEGPEGMRSKLIELNDDGSVTVLADDEDLSKLLSMH